MAECLQTMDSNCKNCYKCIRSCPVKSLKFTDGQAHIIRDECVLCGECYVVCPQNAKQIRNDIPAAKELIASGKKVFASIAPSFAANYPGTCINDFDIALKKLGFAGAEETAIGAAIVKKEYEKMVAAHEHNVIISSCCHTVNTLIQRHYTNALPYLAKVLSPMQAHALKIKEENPDSAVIFIGPCISKKDEATKYSGYADCVLTFDELDSWFYDEKIELSKTAEPDGSGRTRIFPTSGGILASMDKTDDFNYIVVDGMDNCINALKNIDTGNLKNCFIEMSACSGSCISGPVMKRKERNPISDLLYIKNTAGSRDFDVPSYPKEKISKNMPFDGISSTMPGSSAITEILKKMGKNSPEQELNCGTCGYNTCREKAVAILKGKADLTMCLPFLKEKAESFSDTIINNTPNGIIVLDEQLNIQQMNKAAKAILNLPMSTDITGSPVVRILDPVDYLLASDGGKNVYDKRKYLAEYQKYIEETIICDKEYHIIMILMKDITSEEEIRKSKEKQSQAAIEITDRVVEKQMRVVQEIASLLGETTAETKIALTKLKENLNDE